MHDMSCDESSLFGEEKDAGIGNHISLPGICRADELRRGIRRQPVDLVDRWPTGAAWASTSGRTDRVHADAKLCVVEGHRFSKRVHGALGGRVGCVGRLADDSYQARCVEN